MFKEYESKPIKRMAHKVTEDCRIHPLGLGTMVLTTEGEESVEFKHYREVKVGDYIVLNGEEFYHCNAKEFASRNIV